MHSRPEVGQRLEPSEDLRGAERIAPGEQPAAEGRKSEGMDHGEVDVAAVANEPLVEATERLEQHRQEQTIDDRTVARLPRGMGVAGDRRGGRLVDGHDPFLLAGTGVAIESCPRLAAQTAHLDQRGDHGRGLDAVAVGGAQHEPRIEGRIEADHVVELDRPHRHPEAPRHAIDPLRRHALAEQFSRLVEVRHQDAVDEKARTVVHHHRALAEPLRMGHGDGHRAVARRGAADDLHERHSADGIEEVEAAKPRGIGEPRGEAGDRVGRGVGGDHRLRADRLLDLGEHLLLHVGPLGHALDHDVGPGNRRHDGRHPEPTGEFDGPRRVASLGGTVPRGLLENRRHRTREHVLIEVEDRS